MTRRPDGQSRGLDPIEIYRAQSFATAVYRSELAGEVQQLGYEIGITGRDGRWELDGYTRDHVMAFSRRRQEIEQALAREGLAGAEAAQNIAHRTRRSKDQREEQALKEEWRSRAQEYGIQIERYVAQSRERGPIQFRYPEKAEEAMRQSIDENSEREAVIDRHALEAKALQHAMGKADLHRVRFESERLQQDGRLIPAGDSVNSPRGAHTTPEMVALERGNIELMRTSQGRAVAIGTSHEISLWASHRNLLADQTAVAELTLTSTDWITSIEGRAGAAKTTTVGAIREFAGQGYTVFGFAPTTRAVKSLSEAGVSARTVASLLKSQSTHPASRQAWLIDESSLLPTRQVNRLLCKASQQNVERIVFVGDQRQHHAIEAGRPIYQMQQAGMLVAWLDAIRRQRDPELREAVMHAAKGQVAESLAILERRGDIREVRDIEQRRRQIAGEYLAAHESGQRVLVVSPANDERRELNRTIRAELVARGHVDPLGQEHAILVSRNLSGAQRAIAYHYEVGDVIRFTRGSKQFAIPKGGYVSRRSIETPMCLPSIQAVDAASSTIRSGCSASKSSAGNIGYSHGVTACSSARPTGRSASPTANSRRSNPLILYVRLCGSTVADN
jgi:hypothetical protein